jgi:hypothetical protein
MTQTSPTPSNVAAPLGAPVDIVKQFKQGHSFLGCLCDMRRAVIMLDILGILLGIIGLIAAIIVYKYGDTIEMFSEYAFGAVAGIQVGIILAHLSGMIGAICFCICPILITILMEIAFVVLSVLGKDWITLAFNAFWLYPHVVLCYELAKKIMTKENYYQQERQSCCCV